MNRIPESSKINEMDIKASQDKVFTKIKKFSKMFAESMDDAEGGLLGYFQWFHMVVVESHRNASTWDEFTSNAIVITLEHSQELIIFMKNGAQILRKLQIPYDLHFHLH